MGDAEPKDPFAELLQKGSQAVQQRQPDAAIPLLEQAVQLQPDSFDAHFWLGAAYALAQRWEDAARHLEHARSLNPQVPAVWFNLDVVYWRMQRLGEAIDCFEATLQLDPNHQGAKQALATIVKPKVDTELTPL
jgi:tetratricopeptide (TPR) repeat protein